jgi:nucleoside-diphosphate-sugar epimerase
VHVFVAGANGVLGRRIVPLLIMAAHQVTALTRSPDKGASLLAAGAVPAIADVRDADALMRAVRFAAPDVILHMVTGLDHGDGETNAELSGIGTRNLVDAALRADVGRIIAQSIAWAYEPGEKPAGEPTPLDLTAPEPRRTTVNAVAALEDTVREVPEWVVLRYGLLYGPGTRMAQEANISRLIADEDLSSFVHVDDAAVATMWALTWPTGVVNVCDDEPAPGCSWAPVFCRAVGAPPPPQVTVERRGWARGADNRYAREELCWRPLYPSWWDGFARSL